MSQAQPQASSAREPDPDTIKMFVGQIPRNWDEDECRELFEQFGSVYQLNVLRDKATQASRGCCFVTFYRRADAIAAQAALHNIRVLPTMHHPVQMKPADSENRNERKLFVGMLNKKLTESDVKAMFIQFGHIEDCTVLKDTEGKSRGCAFVTFGNRAYAQQAIKQMHHSQTMEGCSTPLVVKFADTQKEREAKKVVATASPQVNPVAANLASSIQQLLQTPQVTSASGLQLGNQLTALATLLQGAAQPNLLSLLGNAAAIQQQQQQLAVAQQQRLLELLSQQQMTASVAQPSSAGVAATYFTASVPTTTAYIPFAAAVNDSILSNDTSTIQANSAKDVKPIILPTSASNLIQLTGTSPNPTAFEALQNAYAGLNQYATAAAFPQLATNNPLLVGTPPTSSTTAASSSQSSGQSKGPDGCNLFIYHLPQEFSDSDLMTTFMPFGNVLSAKVFIDKQTNLSKCFGFVSFDNAISAQNAITGLNGVQIGSKRLKVQLKRGKDSKPYVHQGNGVTAGTALSI
ncbi:hypothetical protein AB6A40_002297 [Gnathostoma spinigerum]|uniref:Protein alan shepard n=1 Tax=Gnathostoma spinigerum TaxID=75299 RepID=A0ABD6E6C9_9BILA